MIPWHTVSAEEATRRLRTDPAAGLSSDEAARRLDSHGANELADRGAKSPWRIAWEQFASALVVLLIVAAVVSAFLGDTGDAAAILFIVVLNTLLGFRQEYRAEKAMAALKRMAAPSVRVRRDGSVREIFARDLVPGDIVLLAEGNLVPADCRVLESANLGIMEAALTGESEAVGKNPGPLPDETLPVGDRLNMAYMGTVVVFGRGTAAVTVTGMDTELGGIARLIRSIQREPTPLQRRLAQLGRTLAALSLALVGLIFLLGLLRGEDMRILFLTAVSLAVAAVPEGLPAVVTITLALGAQRMLKRNVLIRKLPAVETLGAVTVICSDKTGTITGNLMSVVLLYADGRSVDLRGAAPGALADDPPMTMLLAAGALCNDAVPTPAGNGDPTPVVSGDPTESALLLAAVNAGLRKDDLERSLPRVAEAPFDTVRRRMTTIHRSATPLPAFPCASPYVAFTKGAVDGLLDVCSAVRIDGAVVPLDGDRRARIASANEAMSGNGMRVLGVAYRWLDSGEPPAGGHAFIEEGLTFLGMAAMIDPARPGVAESVETCRVAGIRPVMITGDHPLTALHVAVTLGFPGGGRVMTGKEVAALEAGEMEAHVEDVSVFARVAPEQKLKIVTALQNRGHVVAMTGDGVNDAPALKKADIGVAMGRAGTDVAKEASDMVLLDDDFSSIVAAVGEGRVLYDNIRKFIKYILMSNVGEILVMLAAPFLGMPLPLLPLQILWINLVTDGLPALALAVEPAEKGTMRRPPRNSTAHILGEGMASRVLGWGALTGLVPLAAGYWYWTAGRAEWQTMVFCTLAFTQMGNVLGVRTGEESLFRAGPFSNVPLVLAVTATVLLQLLVVYLPPLRGIFRTVPLPGADLLACLAASTAVFWGIELDKWRARRGKVLS